MVDGSTTMRGRTGVLRSWWRSPLRSAMKVIDPNWIMSPGVKLLTRQLAMELADADFAAPYLARQLSVF